MNQKSKITLFVVYLVILLVHFGYYPKWNKTKTEATISWDVSGYYMYLPATFIYKDIKQCSFKDSILQKYQPTPDFQQAFMHKSGNYVMKYSIGQAIMYTPFFAIAHGWASVSESYPADGFSRPYQLMISLGTLLIAFLGLYFLRRCLLRYFEDLPVAVSLIALVLGTNYLNYAAIDGAMTHSHLFTIYSILIYVTIRFYERPSYLKAAAIGALVGLAALTRPTEILSAIMPMLWGIESISITAMKQRISWIIVHWQQYLLAVVICGLIGSIQLMYWKYVSGEWIVYSYEDQGFDWLKPHLRDGLLSYKSGWLIYTPMMIFSLIGLFFLRATKQAFIAILVFSMLFIYVTFAWNIWWYGGSLGQRAMVQSYAVLMFPFCAFITWLITKNNLVKIVAICLMLLFSYFNLWFTHQAHYGGMLPVGQMTKAYFWKTLGTYTPLQEDLKLLDTNEDYDGIRINERLYYENSFDSISWRSCQTMSGDSLNGAICLTSQDNRYEVVIPIDKLDAQWIDAAADFQIKHKEWNYWTMTQFSIQFYDGGTLIKDRMIRVQRHLNDNETKRLDFQTKIPEQTFDQIKIVFWLAESPKEIIIDNLKLILFDE